jgi:N-acetylglucosaminyldiphosphoundecaprenol N-acetyl-beta-D-mannosaminyltransferase
MSGWLTEIAAGGGVDTGDGLQRDDALLRLMDIVIASLSLVVMALPMALAIAVGRLQQTICLGRDRQPFGRWSIAFGDGKLARLLAGLGAAQLPVLFNILIGDMAFVGPRAVPRDAAGAELAACPVRPGLVSIWTIRRRTAVDFGSEADADREYLALRGLKHDFGLLLRSLAVKMLKRHDGPAPQRIRIGDVAFDNLSMPEAVARVRDLLDGEGTHQVSFVNPACVNIAAGNRGYRHVLARASLVLPDGIGIKIAGDMLGTPLRQNVNGTDLFPRLCDMLAGRRAKLFLLGGQPGVPQRVAEVIAGRWPTIQLVGVRDGFFGTAQEGDVAAEIRASGADIVLVARGVPLQDTFIDRHLHHLGVKVAMGVGGLFDFVSGRIHRAPRWMRDTGLEWVYRLIQEPGRMWRRYLVGNLTFLARVSLQRLGMRGVADDGLSGTSAPVSVKPVSPPVALRAVIFATDCISGEIPLASDMPASALPFGGISFIEHTLEQLAEAGVALIDLVASDRPEQLRRLVGDGARWGIQVHWHLVKDPARPYGLLRTLEWAGHPRVLIGHADRHLPAAVLTELINAAQSVNSIARQDRPGWTGWASVDAQALTAIPPQADFEQLADWLAGVVPCRLVPSAAYMKAGDAEGLLAAQTAAMADADRLPLAWRRTPWGGISPRARVSPLAVITGPVLIGPGCYVAAGAKIGPNAVLTRNVVVGAGTEVHQALVLPDTLLGENVEVVRMIVAGQRVRHLRYGVETLMPHSDGLVRGLRPLAKLRPTFAGRVLAWSASLLTAPAVIADQAIRSLRGKAPRWAARPVVVGRDATSSRLIVTRLRRPSARQTRADRVFARFGAVLDVAEGRRCWIGARPRSDAEWHALPRDWQVLLSDVPIGVFHAQAWDGGDTSGAEARAAADVYYAVRRGWRENLRVLGLTGARRGG